MPEFNWSFVILGGIGGLLPDILRLIQNRYELKIPDYFRKAFFWISVILMMLIGALVAWILEANGAKQALAYGFGAPEILSRVLGKISGGADRGAVDGGQLSADLFAWWGS